MEEQGTQSKGEERSSTTGRQPPVSWPSSSPEMLQIPSHAASASSDLQSSMLEGSAGSPSSSSRSLTERQESSALRRQRTSLFPYLKPRGTSINSLHKIAYSAFDQGTVGEADWAELPAIEEGATAEEAERTKLQGKGESTEGEGVGLPSAGKGIVLEKPAMTRAVSGTAASGGEAGGGLAEVEAAGEEKKQKEVGLGIEKIKFPEDDGVITPPGSKAEAATEGEYSTNAHKLSLLGLARVYGGVDDLTSYINAQDVKKSMGLSTAEAEARLKLYGKNMLTPPPTIPEWLKLARNLLNP